MIYAYNIDTFGEFVHDGLYINVRQHLLLRSASQIFISNALYRANTGHARITRIMSNIFI